MLATRQKLKQHGLDQNLPLLDPLQADDNVCVAVLLAVRTVLSMATPFPAVPLALTVPAVTVASVALAITGGFCRLSRDDAGRNIECGCGARFGWGR